MVSTVTQPIALAQSSPLALHHLLLLIPAKKEQRSRKGTFPSCTPQQMQHIDEKPHTAGLGAGHAAMWCCRPLPSWRDFARAAGGWELSCGMSQGPPRLWEMPSVLGEQSWELLPSASVLQRNVNTLSLLLVRRVINTLVSRWSRAPHRYNPSTEKNPEEFLSQAPSVRGRCDGWDWRHLSVAFTPVLSRRRRQQACLGSGAERRQPSHPSARGERSGASPSPGRGSEPGTNVACVVGRAASRGSREQNTDLTRSSAESPECIKQSPAARVARKGRHEASGLSGRYVRAAAA